MPALSYTSIYDAPPSFLPQPSSKMQYAVSHSALPPPPPSSHTPPPGSASSSASPFHHSVRRISHSPTSQQQQQESIVYAHSPPLPHAQMLQTLSSHSSGGGGGGGQSVYVVQPSHSYSPPAGSFQRVLPAQVSTIAQPYHVAAQQQQPHSPTHAGAFRPFKPAPISPPSAIRPGLVYSFPPSSVSSTGSPSSPVPVAASSSQPTILIHPSYSPSASYPRLLSSPIPHSPVDAVVRPLAVRRTGSPPLPSSSLLSVPGLTSQSSCPTCSHHSHPSHSQMHTRTLSNGSPAGFIVSSGSPQYHTVQSHPQHPHHLQHFPHQPSHQHHPPHHSSHGLSPACLAAGCAYPVSPRSEHRMITSDDDDAYSHHSHHSHLSLPSSSSSSSPSLGQPRYSSSGSSSFIASTSSSAPHHPQHPHPHYVVAAAAGGSYSYSPPVAHSHLSSQQPGRGGLPSHVQYGAPPTGTAYTVQSIPITTLSPQSASPSSASSTSSSVSGPFPSAASSTSAGSSSSLSSPSSPRAKSKRSAAHMREFVRNYFLRHSASLVNKDLTSISAELQAAYEKETAANNNGDANGSADGSGGGGVGDRKPVFCRTFIQKVARSLGFILTLHFGLVDKRMKHLMKIRKRGKKNNKKHTTSAAATNGSHVETAGADGEVHAAVKREQHDQHEQHERQQQHRRGAVDGRSAVEDEVAVAAHHIEEMAAALDARGSERAIGSLSAAAVKAEEADDEQHNADKHDHATDHEEEAEGEDIGERDQNGRSTPHDAAAAAVGSQSGHGSDRMDNAGEADPKNEEAAAAPAATTMDV